MLTFLYFSLSLLALAATGMIATLTLFAWTDAIKEDDDHQNQFQK